MERIDRRTAITRLVQIVGATGVVFSTPSLAEAESFSSQGVPAAATDLPYPAVVQNLVDKRFPGWRLPARCDVFHDWADNFDPDSLSPILARGDFFGDKNDSFAFIIMKDDKYKIVLARELTGGIQVFELTEGHGLPQCMYIHAVKPGTHRVGESVRHNEEGPTEVTIKHSGIEVGMFESASCLYFWNDSSSFLQQWMSD